MKQKTIGMIGGASWESTALYYQWINQSIHNKYGGLSSAKILLYSINYAPIVELEREGRWEEIGHALGNIAKQLEAGGADFILLCCNTLHKVASSITSATTLPFLHIADAAGNGLTNGGIKKIGLLGTQFTMEDGFYSQRLYEKFGIETLCPDKKDRGVFSIK